MKIAIASGKGGTGKTTVAVSMALAASEKVSVTLLDCDVEEPNSGIFLSLSDADEKPVKVKVPQVSKVRCSRCGKCSVVCQFNAIAVLKNSVMVFPELCHACGGCALFCPAGAIDEVDRTVGQTSRYELGNLIFAEGRVNVGEAMSISTIRSVKDMAAKEGLTILDCPPGTACPMVAAVSDADYAILVTEPTPFGLNDLKLAVDTVRELRVPLGVIVNRAESVDTSVRDYCREEKIELLMEIPDRREVAEGYSRGRPLLDIMPELADELRSVLADISKD